jgi:hypothetical protein
MDQLLEERRQARLELDRSAARFARAIGLLRYDDPAPQRKTPTRQAAVASAHMSRLWQDPEFRARSAAKASARMTERNADPIFREANRQRSRDRMAAQNADPAFKERQRQAMREMHARPDVKAIVSERMRRLNSDPAFKAKQRAAVHETVSRQNADPAFCARRQDGRRLFEPLPLMSMDEMQIYKKLRNGGLGREEAAAEAMKDRHRTARLVQR